MKLGLVLLASLSLALMGILTGISTAHNDEIEDLQAQQEQLEQQQDYIEEVHSYINDYTYEDGGKVFVYIDEDGNHFD